MTRLFFSLYLFITITLIGLSAVLNEVFFDDHGSSTNIQSSIDLLSLLHQKNQLSPSLLSQKGISSRLINKGDIPWQSQELARLNSNQGLVLYNQDDLPQVYFNYDDSRLIEIDVALGNNDHKHVYWYSAVFFVLLGLGIVIWIYPLWRDLQKLKKSAEQIDLTKDYEAVSLTQHSLVYPIGEALDALSVKVRELVHTQTELTSAVAHEFRTPLSRIKFALEAIDSKSEDKNKKAASAIREDIQELEKLMEEMLSYTSVDNQRPELNISQIPLIELVKQRINAVSVRNESGISIELIGDSYQILADEHFVARAIDNLLNNALKYAKSKIVVNTQMSTYNSQSFYVLSVEDDGEGIAQEHLESVFEPFFRLDKSRTRQAGGTGLGLAIVNRIANWHEAKCWAEASSLGGASLSIAFRAFDDSSCD